ncbi:MAG: pilin [Candidatus Moraniibacteriota bacterium]
MKKIYPTIIVLTLILLPLYFNPTPVHSLAYTPLEAIPGVTNASDFPSYLSGIYKFALWSVGIAAMFMITIGGAMYLTSAGNTSAMGNAKNVIEDAIIGLILAISAWFLLNFINPAILSGDLSIFSTMAVPAATTPPTSAPLTAPDTTPTPGSGATGTDAALRAQLASAGITVNKANCATPADTNCTSLDGMPVSAINNLIALKNACGSGCTFVVTGGTEAGHKSHGPGKPMIDIRDDSGLRTFLQAQKSAKTYGTFGIGQICTVAAGDLQTISYNHSYTSTCQDPSSTAHFHFSFNG